MLLMQYLIQFFNDIGLDFVCYAKKNSPFLGERATYSFFSMATQHKLKLFVPNVSDNKLEFTFVAC